MKSSFPVLGMDCYECSKTIKKAVKKLKGVKSVEINYMLGKVEVDFDPEKVTKIDIEKAVEDAGYKIAYKSYETMTDKSRKFIYKRGK